MQQLENSQILFIIKLSLQPAPGETEGFQLTMEAVENTYNQAVSKVYFNKSDYLQLSNIIIKLFSVCSKMK